MKFEYMNGAIFFGIVNAVLFLLVILLFLRGFDKLRKNKNIYKEVVTLVLIGIFLMFFGSLVAPKQTIDTPKNVKLYEYNSNDNTIEIYSPPPRTETLEGFVPLKQTR